MVRCGMTILMNELEFCGRYVWGTGEVDGFFRRLAAQSRQGFLRRRRRGIRSGSGSEDGGCVRSSRFASLKTSVWNVGSSRTWYLDVDLDLDWSEFRPRLSLPFPFSPSLPSLRLRWVLGHADPIR